MGSDLYIGRACHARVYCSIEAANGELALQPLNLLMACVETKSGLLVYAVALWDKYAQNAYGKHPIGRLLRALQVQSRHILNRESIIRQNRSPEAKARSCGRFNVGDEHDAANISTRHVAQARCTISTYGRGSNAGKSIDTEMIGKSRNFALTKCP